MHFSQLGFYQLFALIEALEPVLLYAVLLKAVSPNLVVILICARLKMFYILFLAICSEFFNLGDRVKFLFFVVNFLFFVVNFLSRNSRIAILGNHVIGFK